MNVRTLKKELPKNFKVQREGRDSIRVEAGGLKYRVDNSAGTEAEAAAYLRSRIPVAAIPPQP